MATELAEIINIAAIVARLPVIATVLQAGLMQCALFILPTGGDLQSA